MWLRAATGTERTDENRKKVKQIKENLWEGMDRSTVQRYYDEIQAEFAGKDNRAS